MAVIILMLLMLAMSSCQSSKVEVDTKVKIVYVVPELVKPKFPDPTSRVIPYDKDFNKVNDVNTDIEFIAMPFWYYKQIVEYKVNVDEQFTKYEAFKSKLHPP